jgi:hypothetical protein
MENSSLVARVYKPKWGGKILALFAFVCGTLGSVGYLSGRFPITTRREYLLVPLSIGMMISGFFLTAYLLTARIILSYDAIESRSIFGRKRLLFSDIRGRHEIVTSSRYGITSKFKLESKIKHGHILYLDNSFTFDDAFYNWLYQLPDLDAEDVPEPCA